MGMSRGYYSTPGDRQKTIGLLHAARGPWRHVFDTAEVCSPFANEELIGEALAPVRDRVVIATKFGFEIGPDGTRLRFSNKIHFHKCIPRLTCCVFGVFGM
jgi:aryl-alcohol dehydrogenase-like predicted oxidoreductase